MKTDTHGNGNGLNDLYILPETPEETGTITRYLRHRAISHHWSHSDVEGQEWYGKNFIEIPFGEGLLGVIEQELAAQTH